jgi:tetratricopeptide (TPR) repeat protein
LESSAVNAVLDSPSSPPYVEWKELIGKYPAQFERMYHLGVWYKNNGQQGVTVAVWRELLQSNEQDDDSSMMLLLRLGEVLTDEKRYDEAVEMYKEAIAEKPSYLSPRDGLAELHRKKGSYREAAEIYENAIEREPMRLGLWFRLCKLYLDTGNLASAIRVCTQEIKKRPSNPSPVMILSNVYASQGHYHSAIREYMNFTDRTEFSAIEDNLKTALAEVNDPWVASTFVGVRDMLRRWTNPLD